MSYACRELRGVKVRLEIGPKESLAGSAVLAVQAQQTYHQHHCLHFCLPLQGAALNHRLLQESLYCCS
jgi:hypothetical protein